MDNNLFLQIKELRDSGISINDIFDRFNITEQYEKDYLECSLLYNEKQYITAFEKYKNDVAHSNMYPTLGLFIFDRVYDTYEDSEELLELVKVLNIIGEIIPTAKKSLKDLYFGISSDFAYYVSTIDKNIVNEIKVLNHANVSDRMKHLKRCPIIDFKDDIPKPKKLRAVCVVVANNYAAQQYALTRDSVIKYAEKCDADYIELKGDQCPKWPMGNKYRIHSVTKLYEKTLYVDCDIYIRPHASDIFKHTPNDKVSIINEYYEINDEYQREVEKSKKSVAEILNLDRYFDHDIVPNCGLMVIPKSCADFYKQPEKSYPMDWCFDQNYMSITTRRNAFYTLNDWPMLLFNCCASHRSFLMHYQKAHFVHCNVQPQEYRSRMMKHLISDTLSEENIYPTEEEKRKNSYFEISWHKKPTISLVVACKDRQQNLSLSLKSWTNSKKIDEIVIVDFSSKQYLSENKAIDTLIRSDSRIKLLRVEGEEYFNLGKAYNVGIDNSTGDFVLKMDCDYFLKDDDWIDDIIHQYRVNGQNHYIYGSYEFSDSLSGFVCFKRTDTRFREDLNGWGYDDTDIKKRMDVENKDYTPIIWFDISKSITHLNHTHDSRVKNYNLKSLEDSNLINAQLCQHGVSKKIIRNRYSIEDNIINFKKKPSIEKTFCINLETEPERWNKFKHIPNVERVNAIDSRENPNVYRLHDLKLQPVDISQKLYLNYHRGAIGCFLSHYKCWKKIIEDKIEYSMIIEDDLCPDSLDFMLKSNLILGQHDIINLSSRIYTVDDQNLFFGAECYVLSLDGARRLYDAVQDSSKLKSIKTWRFENIEKMVQDLKIKDEPNWPNVPSISCALDRFIGHVCELKTVNWFHYPIASLSDDCDNSAINKNEAMWDWNTNKIQNMLKKL